MTKDHKPTELADEALDGAQGGALSAVAQKVRQPALRTGIVDGTSNISDGTSNTIAGLAGDGSV